MAPAELPLAQQWNEVVSELTHHSESSDPTIPAFTARQRAFLSLAKPVELVPGFALITTPHEMAAQVISEELGQYIAHVLGERMGVPCHVEVTVDPDFNNQPQQHEPAAPAPAAPAPASAAAPVEKPQPAEAPAAPAAPAVTPEPPAESLAEPWNQNHSVGDEGPAGEPVAPPHHTAADAMAKRFPREQPAHNPDRETSLNPKYTFDSFVVGSSNRFASGAAIAVAENPARAYNPLFISGGSGLGKTHLLHAAGNYAQVLQPGLRIKYVSSEEFTNDYINSVRDDRQESFKRRYRNLDILMVDDIQFLQGKEGTQEEFFHTFNALHQANKQIILSSDRPPKELTTLEDRLRTRFQAGLITDIQPPDLETRIAILLKKAEADGTRVEHDVLELIASSFESSIRELEGALIRVSAYSSLVNEPINMEMAEIALRDILPTAEQMDITPELIISAASEYFDFTVEQIQGTGKTRPLAHARQLAMYLCREMTDLSLPKIGEAFGGRDHSTVIYAVRKINEEMTKKQDTYDEIRELTQKIKTGN